MNHDGKWKYVANISFKVLVSEFEENVLRFNVYSTVHSTDRTSGEGLETIQTSSPAGLKAGSRITQLEDEESIGVNSAAHPSPGEY